MTNLPLGKAGQILGLFLPPLFFAKRIGGLDPSPNQAGGLGSYSYVPIPLSCRALLPFIMKQSSENIVTRYSYLSPARTDVVRDADGNFSDLILLTISALVGIMVLTLTCNVQVATGGYITSCGRV